MIKTTGMLRIKKIRQSRNGAFCVADLTTDFGEFKVKDPMLDQFDEGEYQGRVWISEIYLAQYIAYGKAVVEMRARLHDVQIQTEDLRPVRPEPAEIDPLDEAPTMAPASAAVAVPALSANRGKPARSAAPATGPAEQTADRAEQASSLFDEEQLQLIDHAQPIKLDATVDRALLRAQAAELARAGYRFDPKTQTWHHKAKASVAH